MHPLEIQFPIPLTFILCLCLCLYCLLLLSVPILGESRSRMLGMRIRGDPLCTASKSSLEDEKKGEREANSLIKSSVMQKREDTVAGMWTVARVVVIVHVAAATLVLCTFTLHFVMNLSIPSLCPVCLTTSESVDAAAKKKQSPPISESNFVIVSPAPSSSSSLI